MKRFFALSFFFLLSVAASAQIRIEKRHYNKGWYISRNHSAKTHADTAAGTKAIVHASAKKSTSTSGIKKEDAVTENIPADSSAAQIAKPVPAKAKTISVKAISKPAQDNPVSAEKTGPIPFHANASFSREAKTAKAQAADPGDSFWVYLFDSLRPFFIAVGIILLAFLAAIIIYGLITNPIATILGLVLIIFCPDLFLLL